MLSEDDRALNQETGAVHLKKQCFWIVKRVNGNTLQWWNTRREKELGMQPEGNGIPDHYLKNKST